MFGLNIFMIFFDLSTYVRSSYKEEIKWGEINFVGKRNSKKWENFKDKREKRNIDSYCEEEKK